MIPFRVTITMSTGISIVRTIDAADTVEALDKAHDIYWPEYRRIDAMPAPTLH